MIDFSNKLRPAYDTSAVLKNERKQSSIDVKALSRHLLSRDGFLERQARILRYIEGDPTFDKRNMLNLSRPVRLLH